MLRVTLENILLDADHLSHATILTRLANARGTLCAFPLASLWLQTVVRGPLRLGAERAKSTAQARRLVPKMCLGY